MRTKAAAAREIAKEKVKRRLASLAMSEKIQGRSFNLERAELTKQLRAHMRAQGLPVRAE